MKNFYLISFIIFFISYFFSIILKQYITISCQDTKLLLKKYKKISLLNKPCYLYPILLLFVIIWLIVLIFCAKLSTTYYVQLRIFKYSFISKLGIAIIFFILGLLCGRGTNFCNYALNNPIYIIKTTSLTGIMVLLLSNINLNNKSLVIGITILTLVYILDYLNFFNNHKKTMNNIEFILNFIWLLIISFINSFILIYNIWNV